MIRRVILLYVLLPLGIVASRGQDNQNKTEMDEIFQEGRKWIVMNEIFVSPTVGRRVFSITGYECEGDNVVDGHLCNVLSCYSMYDIDNPFDVTEEALYSEGNTDPESKVYIYRDGSKYYQLYTAGSEYGEELIFDFSVNKGDTIHHFLPYMADDPLSEDHYMVTAVGDTVLERSSDKRVRKWVYVIYPYGNYRGDLWIEGIGSLSNGPVGSQFDFAGSRSVLFKCFDDSNIFYNDQTVPWDKNLISSINKIDDDKDTDSKRTGSDRRIYTLQGIKTDAPSKGIHIIRYSDGRVKKVYKR